MADLNAGFARFIAGTEAVRFGRFQLKSGKLSDIFMDFGQLRRGSELATLGAFFADYLVDARLTSVDALFGPAYKGINIAIATSIQLHLRHGKDLPVAYNRKVAKTHAEGGQFVGADLSALRSVLVLDDVFTDGGTKYEVIQLLQAFQSLRISAMVVGVDRQEADDAGRPYVALFQERTGIPVHSLTNKANVLELRGGLP